MSSWSAARPGRGRRHGPSGDPTAGMPLGPDDPLTFPGQLQQLRKLSVGLASLTGWLRTVARLSAALALLVIVAIIAIGVAHSL